MSIPEKDALISSKLLSGQELDESEIAYFLSCMGEHVSEEEGDDRRWTRDIRTVTRYNGKLYVTEWGRALTENNESEYLNQPYEIPENDLPKPALSLYLLTQEENTNYETYDSCVVCAESEDGAKRIHPDPTYVWSDYNGWVWKSSGIKHDGAEWANCLDNIHCKLIGTAAAGIEKGVVCASFNAG